MDLESALKRNLKGQGFETLYPPQETALPAALSGKNVVLAVPTASGKSLVAYLAIVNAVLKGKKAVYIVPLRALASEKFDDLRKFEELGIRVGISVGDYDSDDPTLERYDVVIATSEKMDSLLRHRIGWLDRVSVVVADEIHLMNDPDRGPTLEVTLTKFRMINPQAQIIALSATIKNSREIAEWLDASHFTSEWRPVPLKEGIYLDGRIFFSDNSTRTVSDLGDPIVSLASDCISNDGQVLIFVNTRRSSEALANSLRSTVKKHIDKSDNLKNISKSVSYDEDEPTSIGKKLSECIKSGVAFHNAGLTNEQRRRVEDSFREGKIKVIVATPTLAAGINLPARMVIIREATRYDTNYGHTSIPVLEIKQMCGRAGRPRYDEYGEALFIAKDEDHQSFLLENYLLAEPENIYSKLGTEPALRSHVLAAIATGSVGTAEGISEFLRHSFLATQTDIEFLEDTVSRILAYLAEHDMIRLMEHGAIKPTFFGKRVSDLYIDPASAITLRKALETYRKEAEFGILHALAATNDLQPLYLRQSDYGWVEEKLDERRAELILEPPDDLAQYEFYLAEIKTASLISDWIEEKSEEEIEKKFGIGPGDIRNKMEIAEWMAYSMDQLSAIFRQEAHPALQEIVARISKGIKSELVELVKIRNIGRVRARILYSNGYRTAADLRMASLEDLARLPAIGNSIAAQIKRALGQDKEAASAEQAESGQKTLREF
ncbi:MAG: DEAD/DEAH box helicase [Thermoplasmata archaeon]|nr:DEAD/DEAH box helicase [Thermoplasmata archaeon]